MNKQVNDTPIMYMRFHEQRELHDIFLGGLARNGHPRNNIYAAEIACGPAGLHLALSSVSGRSGNATERRCSANIARGASEWLPGTRRTSKPFLRGCFRMRIILIWLLYSEIFDLVASLEKSEGKGTSVSSSRILALRLAADPFLPSFHSSVS